MPMFQENANWDVKISLLTPFMHFGLVHLMPSDGRLVFASGSRCYIPISLLSSALLA